MTFQRKRLGKYGEDIAVRYLKKKGYKILERNFRCKFGEVDILAQDGDNIVIVEVKTKTGEEFGAPEEEVDWFKKKKLRLLAMYISGQYSDRSIRIDVISILHQDIFNQSPLKIEHIIGAVEF